MTARQPESGDRVQHITSGDVGTLDHYFRPNAYTTVAMVRWDKGRDGPGMFSKSSGCSHVPPRLLTPHRPVT